MQTQTPIEINHSNNITASVIWLHGLGANGHDFEPVVKMLACPHIRFILPHAPQRPVTLNNGIVMPAWYDLFGLTADAKTDEAGLDEAANYVMQLIEQEMARGIEASRIVIAGFSQGGAVALHLATRQPVALAGIMALSTYLPLAQNLNTNTSQQNSPWLMTHGLYDEVITLNTAETSQKHLTDAGYQIDFRTYPMAHQVCEAEIADIEHYLLQQLPIK